MPSQSVDPRTGQEFGPVIADTEPAELDRLIRAAAAALDDWWGIGAAGRAAAVVAVADALDAHTDELAALADAETGLGLARLSGEVARTSFQLRMFAGAVCSGDYDGVIVDPAVAGDPPAAHPDLRRMFRPVGPVAVYGASNFPFAFSVLGGDTASALAAGCPVVAKAHPSHPQTSQAVAGIAIAALASAGAPDGTFALVHGFDAGIGLIDHPLIAAGAFTGSTGAGRALFDRAAARPRPVPFYGELGSVNPVVVTPGAAARETLVGEYLTSLTMGTGQFCTNPSLLLVPAGSDVVDRIAAAVGALPAGTLLNANVASLLERHRTALASLDGVRTVGSVTEPPESGFHAAPGVLVADAATALRERDLLHTECFGPVGVVVEYDGTDELLAVLAALDGCLVGALHADVDEPSVPTVVAALTAVSGRVVWNGWPTGVAVTAGQHHGGPYPASTSALHTSVGTTAIRRFQRPVAYQGFPLELLPDALRA